MSLVENEIWRPGEEFFQLSISWLSIVKTQDLGIWSLVDLNHENNYMWNTVRGQQLQTLNRFENIEVRSISDNFSIEFVYK
jgi:hypothetical protein